MGCKGTPGQAVALPGNVRPSRGVAHAQRLREATSGQAVMLPNPHSGLHLERCSFWRILRGARISWFLMRITILKVVMEKVPAVASVGSKGTPGQAVALPGNVRPSRGVAHTPRLRQATSGQAVMLPNPLNYSFETHRDGPQWHCAIMDYASIRMWIIDAPSAAQPKMWTMQWKSPTPAA